MPDEMVQNTPNSSRRSHTPDEAATEVRKRRRIALSCYDCRRRKLRCDREYPACGRCRKGGHADTCSYDSRAEHPAARDAQAPAADSDDDRAAALSPTSSNTLARPAHAEAQQPHRDSTELLAYQRKKIAELENRLAQLEGKSKVSASNGLAVQHAGDEMLWPGSSNQNRRPAAGETDEGETMLLRGKAFKTAYFGRSNITSVVITHFPGLRSFMQATFKQYPALMQGRPEMKAMRERWKKQKQASIPSQDLNQLLPPREAVDQLIRHYFDTFETTQRILHRPSFWDEYATFWAEAPPRRRPEFVATLLAVLSTVITAAFTPPTTYRADRTIQYETAHEWCEAVEYWLSQQSRKHADISHFQIRCLLMQAKCVNSIKWKEIWPNSRNLITFGLSTGLHRDPSWLVKETTIFHQEMRRRLWATMLEMELQCSIYRGMPSSSHGLFSDAAAPLNVNDEDIDNTARKAPPTPWPVQEFTETSFLHVSAKSLRLRIEINSALNNEANPLTYDETISFAERVISELEKIPSWTGRDIAVIPRMLLDIQLRQFLILLHEPFARKAGSDSRYVYSRNACFDAAASVIDQHHKIMAMGNKTVLLPLWNDTARAAISIIHIAFMSSLSQDYCFFQNHQVAIAELVEKALVVIEEKTIRTGAGFGHLGHISAAYDLLIAKVNPEEKDIVLKHNVERVLRLQNMIKNNQEPYPELPEATTNTSATSVMPVAGPSGYATAPGMPGTQIPFTVPMAQHHGGEPPIITFPEIQGWGLDELWGFGPIEL